MPVNILQRRKVQSCSTDGAYGATRGTKGRARAAASVPRALVSNRYCASVVVVLSPTVLAMLRLGGSSRTGSRRVSKVIPAISLRARYTMFGTDVAISLRALCLIRLHACSAVSGTALADTSTPAGRYKPGQNGAEGGSSEQNTNNNNNAQNAVKTPDDRMASPEAKDGTSKDASETDMNNMKSTMQQHGSKGEGEGARLAFVAYVACVAYVAFAAC
eukprot:2832365-Rhodomonas_salina.1